MAGFHPSRLTVLAAAAAFGVSGAFAVKAMAAFTNTTTTTQTLSFDPFTLQSTPTASSTTVSGPLVRPPTRNPFRPPARSPFIPGPPSDG